MRYHHAVDTVTARWSIEDLRDRFLKIDMSPNYQRESNLWTAKQKSKLIDSVLNGFDIPKFYVTRLEDSAYDWAVADGKQRISVLMEFLQPAGKKDLGSFEFLDPGFKLPKNFVPDRGSKFMKAVLDEGTEEDIPKPNMAFENFSKVAKRAFLNAKLDFVEITINLKTEQTKILELYERLNDGKPLTNTEKRYALPGALNSYLQHLVKEHEFFTKRLGIPNKRYQHYDMANKLALMAVTAQGGNDGIIDLKPAVLRTLLLTYEQAKAFDGVKESIDALIKSLKSTFQVGDGLLTATGSIPGYAAFIIQAERVYASPNGIHGSIRKCLAQVATKRPMALSRAESGAEAGGPFQLLREYADALGESTTSARSIRKQAEKLMALLPLFAPEVEPKDHRREFSPEQRLAIWMKSEHKCTMCHAPLTDLSEMHADHVKPHSKGGATSVDNGQPLCESCNTRKSAKY
jgi:hypothetical protein